MSQPITRNSPTALRHFAVTGFCANTLRAFYEYFGFNYLLVEEFPEKNYIATLAGREIFMHRILKIQNSTGDVIELIEVSQEAGKTHGASHQSWSHVAFTVDNCQKAVEDIQKLGGYLVGGPVSNPDAPFRVTYVRDPASNLIELVEPLRQPR